MEILFLTALLLLAPHAHARPLEFRAEAGAARTGYNTFAIPNPAGSRTSVGKESSSFYYRGTLLVPLSERSSLRLLAAPFEETYSHVPGTPLRFNNVTFPASAPVDVLYRFHSFRASYLYRFPLHETLTAQVGGVAKVRVAKIALRGSGLSSEYTNTGFVPLLNLGLAWEFVPAWALRLDVDALAAPQGRAEDGSLELFYRLTPEGTGLSAGYRILEGGADNSKVYTFSRFQYWFGALTLTL